MCGRYRLTRADRLADKFEAIYGGNDEELASRYNIAPTQQVPVVRAKDSTREPLVRGTGIVRRDAEG